MNIPKINTVFVHSSAGFACLEIVTDVDDEWIYSAEYDKATKHSKNFGTFCLVEEWQELIDSGRIKIYDL